MVTWRVRRSLVDNEDVHDCDRVYVALASNRLCNAYDGWGLTAGEWHAHEQRALVGTLCTPELDEAVRRTRFNEHSVLLGVTCLNKRLID